MNPPVFSAYLLMRVEAVDEKNGMMCVPSIGIYSESSPTVHMRGEEYVELMRARGDSYVEAKAVIVSAIRMRMFRSPFWTMVAHRVLGPLVSAEAKRADALANPRGVAEARLREQTAALKPATEGFDNREGAEVVRALVKNKRRNFAKFVPKGTRR